MFHALRSFCAWLTRPRRSHPHRWRCSPLGVWCLEDRTTPSRFADVVSATVRTPLAEDDGVQLKFFAAESGNGVPARVDAWGTRFEWAAVAPGYDLDGRVVPSPDFTGYPPDPDPPPPEQQVGTFRSADGSLLLVLWHVFEFPAPAMQVAVGGQVVSAERMELYRQYTPTHAASGLNLYSNSSLRTKIADPTPTPATKYTGSLFVGPVVQAGDLPSAPIQQVVVDLNAGKFDVTYRSGGTSRLTLKQFDANGTAVEVLVDYTTGTGTPFAQYTGMEKSTDTFASPEISDVQAVGAHTHTGGYLQSGVFEFAGTVADSVQLFRNQRPDRDTLSGPDHVLTLGTTPRIFNGGRVENFVGSQQRQNAQHEAAAVAGSTVPTSVTVAQSGNYLVGVTYSHDNVTQHQLTVTLNGRTFQYALRDTGALVAPGVGWDQWQSTTYAAVPVWLDAGVSYPVGHSATGLAELDTLVLTRVFVSAPVATGPASVSVPLGGTFAFAGGFAYGVSDLDGADGFQTVTVAASAGTVSVNTAGVTLAGGANGSSTVTLRGTLARLTAALATLQYTAPGSGTSATLSVSPHDGTYGGATVTTAISLTAGSPAPAPLFIDFSPQFGLYRRSAAGAYTFLAATPSEGLAVAGDTLFADFGSHGLYRWHPSTAFTRLSTVNPDLIAASPDGYLYVDFGPQYGLYRWSSAGGFSQINTVSPEEVAVGKNAVLFVDFGPTYGLYRWTAAAGFGLLSTVSPEGLVVGADGTLVIDFGPQYGLYAWTAAAGFAQLSTVSPEQLATGPNGQLLVDFGPAYGLYRWNGSAFTILSTVSPEDMTISIDGTAFIDFGDQYGLYSWTATAGYIQVNTASPRHIAARRF